MRKAWLGTILAIGAIGLVPVAAQSTYEEPDYEEVEQELRAWDDESVTLFFTPPIIDLAIDRLMDEMGRHYEFDEDQLYSARQTVKDRFPQFIMENRDDIIRVANDWMAALLGEEPPDPEVVADWAQRARPLMEDFVGLVRESADEMREFMTEEQQIKLDGELAAAEVAVGYATQRLDNWAAGGFDPVTEWHRSPEFKQHERERMEELEAEQAEASAEAVRGRLAAVGTELEQPAGRQPDATQEKAVESKPRAGAARDEWDRYVAEFIQRYRLDEAQRNTAHKILNSLKDSRDKYLRRKLPDIKRLEQRLTGAQTQDDRAALRKAYTRLNAPLERYFQMLKDRLDRIPTRKQRAAAAQADRALRATERAATTGKDKP